MSKVTPRPIADTQVSSHDPDVIREKRIFVLDTNVLLHDSNALFVFLGAVVVIPFVILEELDKFKKEGGELGRSARETIRFLDELREQGSLQEGVVAQRATGKTLIKVMQTPEHAKDICVDSADNQIIALVQDLVAQEYDVTLVTKDINERVKADALMLATEDYVREAVNIETFYKGWAELALSAHELKKMSAEHLSSMVDVKTLFPNQFVVVRDQHKEWSFRIFRFLEKELFREVEDVKTIGDLHARNVEQLMAMDLLLDDTIQLVSLIGPAGTGKTFLALLAGLYNVTHKKRYRRFLISRPIVALGADIGYLPGDVKEKLRHWMMPIYDNLEFIFSQGSLQDREKHDKRRKKEKGTKQKRRHFDHRQISEIHHLEQKGLLSMEAITYMRGRSIPHQFVLIDEVQNLTPHEVKTIVSRAGEGTKIVLCGDPHQIDSPFLDFSTNGLTVTSEKFKLESLCGTMYLQKSERSELSERAAELL